MIRHLAALVLVVAWSLAPIPVAAKTDVEWHQIPEEEFYVVFRPPGLEFGRRLFHKGTTRRTVRYMGRWAGPSDRFPSATMQVIRGSFGGVFTVQVMRGLEYQIKRVFKERVRSLGAEGSTRNALGAIKYQRFTLDGANCVLFVQRWNDALKNWFRASYCVDTAEKLPEKTILKMLVDIRTRKQ